MRRAIIASALMFIVLGTLVVHRAGSGTSAEEGEQSMHPIVGAWVVHDSSRLWPTATVLVTFHSDGSVIATTENGITAQGAWQPTGERTAELNLLGFGLGGGPTESLDRFLSTVEVLADGQTFIRSSAIMGGDKVRGERISPEGASSRLNTEGSASPEVGG